jgi:hypothetical protein
MRPRLNIRAKNCRAYYMRVTGVFLVDFGKVAFMGSFFALPQHITTAEPTVVGFVCVRRNSCLS